MGGTLPKPLYINTYKVIPWLCSMKIHWWLNFPEDFNGFWCERCRDRPSPSAKPKQMNLSQRKCDVTDVIKPQIPANFAPRSLKAPPTAVFAPPRSITAPLSINCRTNQTGNEAPRSTVMAYTGRWQFRSLPSINQFIVSINCIYVLYHHLWV